MGFGDIKNAIKKFDASVRHKNLPPQLDSANKQQPYCRPRAPLPHPASTSTGPDIFSQPIDTNAPPSLFQKVSHNVKPQGCRYGENDAPIQTNNFYNNLALEDQTFPVWTQPYSLWLAKEPGQDVGLAFNHTEAGQRVFGPDPGSNPAQFYFNPPRIKSFVFSGEGINDSARLELENHNKMSVVSKLVVDNDRNIVFPLAHGMGFVTAIYNNILPVIASQVGVQEFRRVGNVGDLAKYVVKLFNQVTWVFYVRGQVSFQLRDPNHIVGDRPGSATVQFSRGDSPHYDDTAGVFPVLISIHGSAVGNKGQYSFRYETEGSSRSGTGLVWCLPHHQEALVSSGDTGLQLDSSTKGVMKGYATNELVMEEELPIDILWQPWASFAHQASFSESALNTIRSAAQEDIKQDVIGMSDIDSMYTSGKILDKFAYIAYVCHFILNHDGLTSTILPKVKQSVERFASNKQKYPLVYDTTWKGLISSAEPGADFGNSNYNDHHFHYGYHIHAIALIAKIDPNWLSNNDNLVKNYTITLLRDVASPRADSYFPESRSFDWFHGHSFAHGIFASGDGKDEESSSEDYHFAYGMKLFANVIGDGAMEGRANLMLAVMKRAMNMYMLYSDDNKIQPLNFIGNKVAGISFENKIDFSTYFGRGTIADEWIHGIHMLPITPISSYIRGERFVKEEWDQKLAPIIDQIPDGWKGILILNSALFNPRQAWQWFARNDWEDRLIDNGMSRTWSLAYIAGIGGSI